MTTIDASQMAAITSNHNDRDGGAARGVYIWAGLALPWAAGIIAVALAHGFEPASGAMPALVALAALLPPLLFLTLYSVSPGVRAWVTSLNASDLTAFQGWRVLGAMFLALWWFGHLPLAFALLAGLGDVAIGLAAPFVAGRLRRAAPGAIRAARWLIIMGVLDFIVAISIGGLSSPGNLLAANAQTGTIITTQFPIVLIPAFIVPNMAILHVMTWLKLRQSG